MPSCTLWAHYISKNEQKDGIECTQSIQHAKTFFRSIEGSYCTCGIQDFLWGTTTQGHLEKSSFRIFLITFFFYLLPLIFWISGQPCLWWRRTITEGAMGYICLNYCFIICSSKCSLSSVKMHCCDQCYWFQGKHQFCLIHVRANLLLTSKRTENFLYSDLRVGKKLEKKAFRTLKVKFISELSKSSSFICPNKHSFFLHGLMYFIIILRSFFGTNNSLS